MKYITWKNEITSKVETQMLSKADAYVIAYNSVLYLLKLLCGVGLKGYFMLIKQQNRFVFLLTTGVWK